MTIFMVIAACYGVIQLAALGSVTRSVRVGLLLTALAVGIYGAGLATVLLQIVYTRSVAEITGDRLSEVVRTASYTVDPFLEEVVKVLPLALVAWQQRVRRQWGLTDYLLLGAATGAGFGLTEAILRFSHRANVAIAADGGWTIPQGFSVSHIPGPFEILFSWLPEPVASESVFSLSSGSGINLHLAWSALAGLGVGLIMRAPGRWKLLGIAPIFYVWADHAVFNHEIVAPSVAGVVDVLSVVINPLHGGLAVYVLLAMIAAGVLDWRALRAKVGRLDLLTTPERMGQPSLQALGAYARVRPPWTPLIAWKFVLARRSLIYAGEHGPTRAEPLRDAVVETRDRIDASATPDAWQRVDVKQLAPKQYRMMIVWLVLLLPAVGYFVLGGFRQTAGLQRFLTGEVMFVVSMLAMLAGLAWLAWQAFQAIRALPAARQFGELTARTQFRLMIAGGALFIGLMGAVRWLGGAGPRSPAVSNVHILDALGSALFYTSIALAILALFMFPPTFAALAGGGALLVIPGALSTSMGIAAIMGMLGILLMMASGGGGGGGSGGPGGGGSPNPPPPKPDMPQKPPAVKPTTADPKLNNLLDNVYKGANNPGRIGNGTTGDAVRNEILTGRPTGGRWHSTKAQETINGLQNWLKRNPGASQADQNIAKDLILELQNALKGI